MSPAPGIVIPVNDDTYNEIIATTHSVIILFTSPWCAGCRKIYPDLEELAAEYEHILFSTLDISANPAVPAQLGVMKIPTLIFFKDGNEHQRFGQLARHKLAAEVEQFA